jgi:hypothetical protein
MGRQVRDGKQKFAGAGHLIGGPRNGLAACIAPAGVGKGDGFEPGRVPKPR